MNFVPVLVFDGVTESMNCLATVNVQDTQPPTIDELRATPSALWPPNHKMIPVTVSVSARDACNGQVTTRIKSISSNDPAGHGAGLDWEITGALTASLRAELTPGSKSPRVYTLIIESLDAAGNSTTKTVDVAVSRE
jgi:hypothetical protein